MAYKHAQSIGYPGTELRLLQGATVPYGSGYTGGTTVQASRLVQEAAEGVLGYIMCPRSRSHLPCHACPPPSVQFPPALAKAFQVLQGCCRFLFFTYPDSDRGARPFALALPMQKTSPHPSTHRNAPH